MLFKFRIILFAAVLCMVLISEAACFADTIFLRSGKQINGEIVEENDEFVKIKTGSFKFFVKYKKKFIEKIEKELKNGPAGEIKKLSHDVFMEEKNNPAQGENETPAFSNINKQTRILENEGYMVYLPQGIDKTKIYPLVIIFHPQAKAGDMIKFWSSIADERQFILYASKRFRDDAQDWLAEEDRMIREVCGRYPVDRSKVIAAGFSGGGMAAHMYSVYRPDLISGVITNGGRIHPEIKKNNADYPRKKVVSFLASPTDTNYKEMRDDRKFLMSCEWQARWVTFDGGHIMAPHEQYLMAVEWIQFFWKENE